jgi:uncharacterized protein (DUF1330 family)
MTKIRRRGMHLAIALIAALAGPPVSAQAPAPPATPAPPAMPALPEKPVPCDKPAYLVVISTITDPVKIGVYREALRDSGLYPALGGYYITSGRPVEVLEGSTFKTSPIVVAKFPCAEAARRFWYSEVYQKKIVPLREGAGSFEVGIFEENINLMRPVN